MPRSYAADGVVLGSNEMGPLAGGGTRALALNNTAEFLCQAKLAGSDGVARNAALSHILKVERDVTQAASNLGNNVTLRSEFPNHAFGNAVKTAAQVVASGAGIAAIKVTLNGFDTHSGQQGTQQRLLKELAEGLVAFRTAMQELGRWDITLMMTYCEFGRRPRENMSGGTDHGTASTGVILGGALKPGETAVDETSRHTPQSVIGAYKRSKLVAEREVERLIRDRNLPAVIVAPSTPIGPRDIKPTPTGRIIVEAATGRMPALKQAVSATTASSTASLA